jgi:hypothetical protein
MGYHSPCQVSRSLCHPAWLQIEGM